MLFNLLNIKKKNFRYFHRKKNQLFSHLIENEEETESSKEHRMSIEFEAIFHRVRGFEKKVV